MNNLTTDGLGKCYYLPTSDQDKGSRRRETGRLWRVPAWLHRGAKSAARRVKSDVREFWALRNVSFAVEPGTVLGVIGANGAGKTTLLKIIARVTPPTEGRVVGVGRVVSLLELGAGFDPDASARDNIFMNAAMHGIPRSEVVRRFDSIIEFAEVGEFVDTPLKHYSSGMYLRLAFSVAINMDPDILLADEILAVGDLAFQERCLQRVEQATKSGLTVLFVSHDMDAVTRICDRVLWLNRGEVIRHGDPEEVVMEYQNAAWAKADINLRTEKGRHVNRFGEILAVRLVSAAGKSIGGVPVTEDVFIKIRFSTLKPRLAVRCGMDVYTRGLHVFRAVETEERTLDEAATYEAWGRIPANLLAEALYVVNVNVTLLHDGKEYALVIYNALSFMAFSSDDARAVPERLVREGVVAPRIEWNLVKDADVVHT